MNSFGASAEPWGTPHLTGRAVESDPSMDTACEWSVRSEYNQLSVGPDIPSQWLCLFSRMVWSTRSNVVEQSKRLTKMGSLL